MNSWWSAGKLLLSGEYWVLHGAEALAIPTQKGQSLTYTESVDPLRWTAFDVHNQAWLDVDAHHDRYLSGLLNAARSLGGHVPSCGRVETHLEFERTWGWGSSSTVTDLIAQWTGVDALALHFATSQGSGFDVASARANGALLYQKTGPAKATWHRVESAHWPSTHLALVYLGAKQDSQREIAKTRREPSSSELDRVSALSRELSRASDVGDWIRVVTELEIRTAEWLGIARVQDRFEGSPAVLKSLGAWGGDFALAIAPKPEDLAYFSKRGFLTLPWSDCVHLP